GSSSNNASFATPPDGSSPRMQMFNFTSTSPQRDADLDAQVIIHEYGHGISNRLTGGPSNVGALGATQSAGMGEGWSDWWSLMLLQKSTDAQNGGYGIGTYLLGQPASGTGIRREPYSYDMSIDALTASAFNSTQEVHNTGEIWCSALWDMNWLLINKYGFGANIAGGYNANVAGSNGGNELGLQLVMDALKLQPVNPSFLNARDAILTADQNLNGGADKLQIWQAFARRGLGFSSTTAGSTSSSITQAFDIPVSLQKPRVLSSTPSGTQSSAVSSVDLAFNKAMNPASFVVSDDVTSFTGPGGMNLLGQISGFSWLNSNQTLRISFAAQNTDGQYALTVGPNILAADDGSAMDQNQNDVAGEMPGDQYTARFGYDSLPLAVASTTPANASVVTLPMTTVDVKFNEPYDPATIGTADLTLSQGSVISATVVDTTTVRYGLSGIASEGTLTVSMAAGALGDLDGNPSNAYGGSFTTDVGTVAFPALAGKNPLGAGVFDGSASGTVGYAGDTDSFTFTVDAGQTITALADPGTTLRPTIELRNGGGTLVGSATAAAANRDAVIQNYAAAAGGAYTITISGNASTTGSYAVGLTLNAALEGEAHDGASNNTTGTAQDLASAFGAINASAARAAVVGTLSSTDTADLFAIALNGGDSLTAVTKAVSGSIADVYLLDSGGATLSYDTTGPSNVDRIISDFIAPAGGAYYLKVFGSTTSTYNLALTKNGEFDTESNDTTATAPWVLSKQSAGTQTAVGRIDTGNIDLYAVTLAAGAHLTAATSTPGDGAGEPLNAFNPRLRLLDSAGTMITSDDNSAADGRNAVLSYTAGTAGKYFVEVSSTTTSSTLGDYVLTIGGASTALPPFTGTITSPASGAKVKTAPTTVTVSFNDSVLLGSVSAGDLTVDGVAATAFSVQGSNSINFTLPTNIAEGTHN
ncbi:MAG TPA: M36 family metallopeptidase, partial [Tepidisphaeraceae bacterium]